MPVEEKRDRADYVIDTTGTMEQTLQQTDRTLTTRDTALFECYNGRGEKQTTQRRRDAKTQREQVIELDFAPLRLGAFALSSYLSTVSTRSSTNVFHSWQWGHRHRMPFAR